MTLETLKQRLNAIEAQSTLQNTYTNNSNQTTGTTEDSDKDSYISTIEDSTAALPSETYGNIMELIKAAKQESGQDPNAPTEDDFNNILSELSALTSETISAGSEEEATTATTSSSGASGSSESSESKTTKEYIVGPDGTIYLQTTTTDSEGNETVTRTMVSNHTKPESMTPPQMMEEESSVQQA